MGGIGVGHVCRAEARRLELLGGMMGAFEGKSGVFTGISGTGQVGGGVGAASESKVAIPGLINVQLRVCRDRAR